MAGSTEVRLELTWPNKDKFLLSPTDETGKPVWVDRDHPAAHEVRLTDFTSTHGTVNDTDPHADNLLFVGDSIDVLRVLAESPEYARHYRGKVKQIYIDPPFNTKQTFEHYDDWMDHSTWLSFMRDRLLLIKDLLAPDGSIWVHLDDAEQHRMRVLMDEVFGANTFIAQIVWQKKYSRDNRPAIGTVHDYVMVYAPSGARWKHHRNRVPRGEAKEYRNPNNDPKGPWRPIPMDVQAGHATASQFYDVVTPSGKTVRPSSGRAWAVNEQTMQAMRERGEIYFGLKGDAKPNTIKYLADDDGLVPWTWWPHTEVGHTDESKKEILALFDDAEAFDTPKPERFIERVLHIGSNPGDIVLDCFGGSGTTAAVAHKMGRRWVTAEILPATVAAFIEPRLHRVIAGTDGGGVTETTGWAGGGGFRTVTVAPSMYEVTPFGVMLADWATNGSFARAVAGQLGFDWAPDGPFAGRRGRMRLVVLDGTLGPEEVRSAVAGLGQHEKVTFVAKTVLPDAETVLVDLSPGSRIKKAPRDLLTPATKKAIRRTGRTA